MNYKQQYFFLSSWYYSFVIFQVFHTFPTKSSSLYVHSVQFEVEDYSLREVRDLISVLHCLNSLNCQKNTWNDCPIFFLKALNLAKNC